MAYPLQLSGQVSGRFRKMPRYVAGDVGEERMQRQVLSLLQKQTHRAKYETETREERQNTDPKKLPTVVLSLSFALSQKCPCLN